MEFSQAFFSNCQKNLVHKTRIHLNLYRCLNQALCKPALNQQKFFVSLNGDDVVITTKPGPMTGIDLGIVKYNFEAASGHKCR